MANDPVQAAVIAERERCAKIAESYPDCLKEHIDIGSMNEVKCAIYAVAQAIERQIRGGK